MSAQHTPGPWSIVPYGDGDSLVIHDARGDWRVCFMATPGKLGSIERIEANAHLIAAAPDLLAVLQDAVANNMLVEGSNWWGRVFAAIAKATGGAS